MCRTTSLHWKRRWRGRTSRCSRRDRGRTALELLLKHEVALAILDVNMPGMDGFELAELMRGSPRTAHVPIIFLTATAQDTGPPRFAVMKRGRWTSCTSRTTRGS